MFGSTMQSCYCAFWPSRCSVFRIGRISDSGSPGRFDSAPKSLQRVKPIVARRRVFSLLPFIYLLLEIRFTDDQDNRLPKGAPAEKRLVKETAADRSVLTLAFTNPRAGS